MSLNGGYYSKFNPNDVISLKESIQVEKIASAIKGESILSKEVAERILLQYTDETFIYRMCNFAL